MQTATPLDAEARARADVLARDARFSAFVKEHQDRAVRIAWRLLGGDDAAAEDVAQEAFVRAFRGLERFREDASMAAWFYGILVNEARRARRWRAVRARWNAAWDHDPPDPMPRADTEPMLRARIAVAVDRLSQGQREAFVLAYLEGFSVEQVAQQLGKSAGTIKSHLHRALVSLRDNLGDLAAPDWKMNQEDSE